MNTLSTDTRQSSFLLFLLGLGGVTKIFFIGTLALSELVIFPLAPFVFLKNFSRMKREGFVTFVYMLIMLAFGALVSALWNHSPRTYIIKLLAMFYGFFAYYIVLYALLYKNFKGIGWFYFGLIISSIITIWAFNPQADVSSTGFGYIGQADVETVVTHQLFWVNKVRGLGQLPIFAAYLKTPLMYSLFTPIAFVAFTMLSTVSGRAQSLCVIMGFVMIAIGRKSRLRMRGIGRHFMKFAVLGVIALFCYKFTYSYAASHGYLGEVARNKYERQTTKGTSALNLLMAGRREFFVALFAVMDHPIIGFGPRAEDSGGYTERFLTKYGADNEDAEYLRYLQYCFANGMTPPIPTHSYIMSLWVWCGIVGLIFFIWVFYLVFMHLKHYADAIPQWYGYYALTIPSMVWSSFFNPFGDRHGFALFILTLCFARAVAKKRMNLPWELELEARHYDMT